MKKALERIVGLVRDACDPEEILLFGSFAKGNATLQSDIDIMVIGDFGPSPKLTAQAVRQALVRMPIKIDVLVLSPQDVATARLAPQGFLGSVLPSAKTLYKKSAEPI